MFHVIKGSESESITNDPAFQPTMAAVDAQIRQLRSSSLHLDERLPGEWKPLRRAIHRAYVRHALDHAHRDGRAAIVMAGAPGAGKSTALRGLLSDLDGVDLPRDIQHYVVVDADEIKTLLLGDPVEGFSVDDDLLQAARARWQPIIDGSGVMPDGAPLMRAELSTLVHRASLAMHSEVRTRLFQGGFNTVVEGTLGWARVPGDQSNPGQGLTLARELRTQGYERVDIFAVDTPLDVCQRQALLRWWRGRKMAAGLPGLPGGRFLPADDIARYFEPDTARSQCIDNALDTYGLDEVQEAFPHLTLTVVDRRAVGRTVQQYVSRDGGPHEMPLGERGVASSAL